MLASSSGLFKVGKASLFNRRRNVSLHSMLSRNCGECPGSYASSLKCREQILLLDEGSNFLRLQNSTHAFLLRCWAADFPLGNEKKNLFHLDFFGCHYCNHIPDSTCCAFGLNASEAAKFVMGYIASETMLIWNLSAPTHVTDRDPQ